MKTSEVSRVWGVHVRKYSLNDDDGGGGGEKPKTFALQTHYIQSNINMLNALLLTSLRQPHNIALRYTNRITEEAGQLLAYVPLKYRLRVLIVPRAQSAQPRASAPTHKV